MNSYNEFITTIQNQKIDKTLYWQKIIEFRKDILLDIAMNGNKKTSRKLQIDPTYITPIKYLLTALENTK